MVSALPRSSLRTFLCFGFLYDRFFMPSASGGVSGIGPTHFGDRNEMIFSLPAIVRVPESLAFIDTGPIGAIMVGQGCPKSKRNLPPEVRGDRGQVIFIGWG